MNSCEGNESKEMRGNREELNKEKVEQEKDDRSSTLISKQDDSTQTILDDAKKFNLSHVPVLRGRGTNLIKIGIQMLPSSPSKKLLQTQKINNNRIAAFATLKRNMLKRHYQLNRHWKLTLKERTRSHDGYYFIDVNSIYDTSMVIAKPHLMDSISWEYREVRQRFLYEKSISFVRNWFGKFS